MVIQGTLGFTVVSVQSFGMNQPGDVDVRGWLVNGHTVICEELLQSQRQN